MIPNFIQKIIIYHSKRKNIYVLSEAKIGFIYYAVLETTKEVFTILGIKQINKYIIKKQNL